MFGLVRRTRKKTSVITTASSAYPHIPPRFAGFDGSGFRSAIEADAIGPKYDRRIPVLHVRLHCAAAANSRSGDS
jgi:hypothetical protein